jgi:hypothetical protein
VTSRSADGARQPNVSETSAISGLEADGTELQAAVFDETEVRVAAGLTMVLGAVAFGYAYFSDEYLPLQVVSTLFFVEFLVRLTAGLRYSPMGIIARAMTLRRPPDWVSAKPKRLPGRWVSAWPSR